MSLVNQNRAFGLWDYLFLVVGVLSGIWFFLSYSSQDPRSTMQVDLDSEAATLKAAELMNSFGYAVGDLESRTTYEVNRRLLDSLQFKKGRSEVIKQLRGTGANALSAYYWQVDFRISGRNESLEDLAMQDDQAIRILLNNEGKWFAFRNPSQRLPAQKLNREALQYAFKEDSSKELWQSVPDTAWDGVLNFNLENGYDLSLLEREETEKDEADAHLFSVHELKRLGNYYLDQSVWNSEDFQLSEVQLRTLDGTNGAELVYESREKLMEQAVAISITVIPTGSLIALDVNYNRSSQNNLVSQIWDMVSVVFIFLFGIVAIVTFFLRMRARAVDTKSALVISILAGLAIPIVIFLERIEMLDPLGSNVGWYRLLGIAFEIGILGALASIAFFVITSIGDSITRQHWQQKLARYDYLRQGLFFNRPIGETMLRSVVLMFILSGFWSLLLLLFPDLYFHLSKTFLVYEAAWPPVYMLLNNAWYSLITMLGIFLVAGGLVYARTQNKWAFGATTTLAVAIVVPIPFSLGPDMLQFLVMGIFGLGLTLIYLKWDILTLLFSHFLALCLLVVSSGWFVRESPDAYVFITFLLFLLFIVGWAVVSIVKGKDERALPDYVPEYVEELAQEQRIKQELKIARDVQQSFLPTQKPDLEGLDIAAVCQPAFETGGDYYDFIQLDDHRVAVTIGDVSGKGIQAAFYMTFTKGILHALCRETDSPGELLKKANRLFFDNAVKGTFISLIYGIIDLEEQTFVFARAGHNPILYLRGKTGEVKELQPRGLGIGLTREIVFDNNIKEIKLNLADGDLLVLYTDGIVEALNEAHNFYGDERLRTLLKDQKNQSSQEILDLISNDVSNYIGSSKQHDDMTIMVIKMNGR